MELKINLNDLWYSPIITLPRFVFEKSCVYRMHNLINEKNYVGLTESRLIDRWRFASGSWCHLDCYELGSNDHKYNAIRKYGPENFEVELIKSNIPDDLLDSIEIYWIAHLESFGPKGYNKNNGGGHCEQLFSEKANKLRLEALISKYGGPTIHMNTPLAIHNRMKSNRDNHGGILAWNTKIAINNQCNTRLELYGSKSGNLNSKDSMERSRKTHILIYGNICGQLHTKEVIEKRLATNTKKYGSPCGQMNTKESEEKRLVTNTEKYGNPFGKLHDKETFKIQLDNHGGLLAFNTYDSFKTKFIKSLNSLKNTISNALVELEDQFVFSINYWDYKMVGSPAYQKSSFIRFFNNCIKYNVSESDLSYIVPHFRKDWVPEELHKYYTK